MLVGFELDTSDHEMGLLPCADICFVLNVYFAVCFAYLCKNLLFTMVEGGWARREKGCGEGQKKN